MSINQLLEKVTVLTEKSISLAQEELWDALIENESQRQSLVSEIAPVLDALDSLPDDARKKLEELIQLNDDLAKICTSRRDELAVNIKQMSTGRQANKAYTE
jgi:flagellar motility protein MotE (MotC chaperone)